MALKKVRSGPAVPLVKPIPAAGNPAGEGVIARGYDAQTELRNKKRTRPIVQNPANGYSTGRSA